MKFGDIKKDNFYFEIKHNETDDFSQCLIVNGIYIRNGGTAVNYIMDRIVSKIREKLSRKFPNIKNGDIKNKLKLLLVIRFFPNLKFTSQEKIEVSNSTKELSEFFGDMPFDKIVRQILKDEDIMLSITEYFNLKEKAKQNAELKKLNKKEKKLKIEKFYPAIKENKNIFLAEGESANGALQPVLGRKENAYFELKGVPLNSWEVTPQKLAKNEELSNLYKILKNYDFEKIVIATDKDADGSHITGLLIGFIKKYLPEFNDKIYILQTPIMAKIQNNKIVKWSYRIDMEGDYNKYFKGYGSWKKQWLEDVIKQDGLDKMLEKVDINNETIINDWLSGKKSNKRKEYIQNYSLDIDKV